jgi:hypothetical protein
MKKILLVVVVLMFVAAFSFANQADFNAGFATGWKSIMGDNAIVPIAPVCPIGPINTTDYEKGVAAGVKAALSKKRH